MRVLAKILRGEHGGTVGYRWDTPVWTSYEWPGERNIGAKVFPREGKRVPIRAGPIAMGITLRVVRAKRRRLER
jgi:hypothetical protein